jgi:hypothetical protein
MVNHYAPLLVLILLEAPRQRRYNCKSAAKKKRERGNCFNNEIRAYVDLILTVTIAMMNTKNNKVVI